jgi:hypothetical protein
MSKKRGRGQRAQQSMVLLSGTVQSEIQQGDGRTAFSLRNRAGTFFIRAEGRVSGNFQQSLQRGQAVVVLGYLGSFIARRCGNHHAFVQAVVLLAVEAPWDDLWEVVGASTVLRAMYGELLRQARRRDQEAGGLLLSGRVSSPAQVSEQTARFSLANPDGTFFIRARGAAQLRLCEALQPDDNLLILGYAGSFVAERCHSHHVYLQALALIPLVQVWADLWDQVGVPASLRLLDEEDRRRSGGEAD